MSNANNRILVYGANGYSAQLIIENLIREGIVPVLAGRNEAAVKSVADKFKCNYKILDLSDSVVTRTAIVEFDFLLNCAGPFKFTANHLIDACIAAQTNYLDITGEIQVIEYAWSKNEDAKSAEIFIAPDVGFDVIPTDCLAKNLFNILPDAISLKLGLLTKRGKISRGTLLTTLEMLAELGKIRKDGKIIDSKIGEFSYQIIRDNFKFNGISIPWGDVSSAYYSTGIKNITVFLGVSRKMFKYKKLTNFTRNIISSQFINNLVARSIKKKITGPTLSERNNAETFLWGKVENKNGDSIENCYQVMEGYNSTQKGAVDIIKKVLEEPNLSGTKTPSMIMGHDYFDEFVIKKIY